MLPQEGLPLTQLTGASDISPVGVGNPGCQADRSTRRGSVSGPYTLTQSFIKHPSALLCVWCWS